MKINLLILSFLIPVSLSAQKIALLNTNFKSPILYTDSVTVQQTTTGLFPVSIKDFDTLYANLDYLKKMLEIRQRSKMESFELHAGLTIIKITRTPYSNGDRYVMKATTNIGELQSNLYLVDTKQTNKRNGERLKKIMDYMKTNKSLFKKPDAIQPKIYNVVIITD